MPRQVINLGSRPNDRQGDKVRTAFDKVNDNFVEVYEALENIDGGSSINREWIDVSSNTVFNIVEWVSGSTIQIEASNTEYANAVTYDARTDSNQIYFVWDQEFIDDVWDGNLGNPEGENLEISLDNGSTWLSAEKNGYSGGTFFYFTVPYELEGSYTFTYTEGQNILIRFNRGSLLEPWFDLENAPVPANTIISVDMNVLFTGKIGSDIGYRYYNTMIFNNTLPNDNNSNGQLDHGYDSESGSVLVNNYMDVNNRRISSPEDAGRIYGTFGNGRVGSITAYWNAKLVTLTQG